VFASLEAAITPLPRLGQQQEIRTRECVVCGLVLVGTKRVMKDHYSTHLPPDGVMVASDFY